ncbi:inner centromere protein-related protein pic1 [Rhizoctonia solani]|uniref:Inner centromere protein-related protein pic1 n=1 Tax=Rhizoctonia solani TaxID=456999 RepID=A0A8H8SVJ2_9AGAM|nr:inner centromere protein-related protein pic1 [Rhizoctonia solani]QRW19379.1 inner centromere protein-related protein pic1 [Rhizoctonia solani]
MSVGFAQWASAIRNRMAADPGRTDFKDQVQCNGYLFLHEYLDDVLNAPRPDNVIEFTKTPGRNKTASKKARALHASAQKIKPVAPIAFGLGPKDKENDASATSPKQNIFKPARSQPNPPPEPIPTSSGPRDSIARATPARAGVPLFGSANRSEGPLPTPSDDPLSPFRDATILPKEHSTSIQSTVTAQQMFTTKLGIEPSSPAPSEKELPVPPAGEPEKALESAEQDLSVIQEDDEGQSVAAFEDAREDFTDARSTTTVEVEEGDVTEIADVPPALAPVTQRLPSPPASEDTPPTASEPPTPVREPEHEPTEPITSTNITAADVFDSAPAPATTPIIAPIPEPIKKASVSATTQPTPPPEPTLPPVTSPRPLPIPPSRGHSGTGMQQPLKPPSFAQPVLVPLAGTSSQPPLNPPRASSTVPRGPFAGPSLKELRREPSVSGNANRELRQSSWRKKTDGTGALTTATSTGSATTDSEPPRLKRKSSALQHPSRPPPSKSQKLSHGSSRSSGSSSEDETEMQVPLKDEDGGSWNTGTSMLDDLRNRLARLEKSTSGKTPAASRVWTPTMQNANLPNPSSEKEKRLSLSDLSVRPPSGSSSAEKGKAREKEPETVVGLHLGLSTDDPAASTLSNRSTTPVDSPPHTRRVLPAPPVFSLPDPAPIPKKVSDAAKPGATAASNTADAVRAAKAEAARLFGGTKFTAPPVRTETQTTVATEVGSVFDKVTQSQNQFTQSTAATQLETQDAEMEDELDPELDLDPDVDVEGDDDVDGEGDEDDAKTTSSRTSSTRSTTKKAPVKGAQSIGSVKKAADEQDRKASRLREMEERRQAAALRKAEEEKSRTLELEKKRKEREELAKSIKAPAKKVTEDPNKKRKLEVEMKAAGKKPAVPSVSTFTQATVSAATTSTATKSRIAKPTATAGPGPSALKSALKTTSSNPFQSAPPAATTKTLKPAASSSSLKAAASKKAKGSISDAPGQALQQQMQARVQAQLKAAQKEPEIQSENIELPDINSEYSDSDDEDRGKDFPSWTQDQALMDALKDQERFNPDALFGPIQPLKMGDLFKTGHSRFRKRTSSANWAGTDGITVEEEMEYARRMGYINQ